MDINAEHATVFDTDQQYLGNVYAKALVKVALDSGKVDAVLSELESFVDDVVDKMPQLRAMLESPRIPLDAKERMIDKIVDGRASVELSRFLKILTRNGRFDCLGAVRSAARDQYNEMNGCVDAVLTTAESVDEAVVTRVQQRLSSVLGQEVNLRTAIDPRIIGGMVVRVGDTVYDASVTNQLNQVKSAALERASQAIRESLDRFAMEA